MLARRVPTLAGEFARHWRRPQVPLRVPLLELMRALCRKRAQPTTLLIVITAWASNPGAHDRLGARSAGQRCGDLASPANDGFNVRTLPSDSTTT